MAQLNITLNQEEILLLLNNNRNEAFRQLLQNSLNSLLKAESEEQLHAAPYERSDFRTDSRNGMRERGLVTRLGKIELQVPRHRNQPFKTMIFDNYTRSEAALIASMAEMVVSGVSTRKVSQVVETLCGTSYSKSTVSELCKELDVKVEAFRNRPLTGEYPFLTVDATYFKVRENKRIISKALMIAYGTDVQGHREVLGCSAYENESNETWHDFLKSLKNRGLKGVLMITSDAHDGIQYAISKEFPDVPWQRCQFHFVKNITEKVPKKFQKGIRTELQEMFNCQKIESAREKRDAIIQDYKDIAEKAMSCLDEGFESAMTVMELPVNLRPYFRTSNHIERVNKELKRRSKVIGIFPNETSLIRLMGSVLIELNEAARTRKAIFGPDAYMTFMRSNSPRKLRELAIEQQKIRAA